MKHKKTQYLLFIAIISLAFSNEASAKWCVVCLPPYGCMAIHAGCGDFARPKKSTCKDLIAFKQTDHLNRLKGGLASFTIDGVDIPIAPDAIELFLLKKQDDTNTALGSVSTTRGINANSSSGEGARGIDVDLKFQNEFEALLKNDRSGVSDLRFKQISQEFGGIGSTDVAVAFSFTTIDLVNKDGKIGCSTTTDKEGNFFFPTIPNGTWTVKISKRTGNLPKVGFMLINGIGDIVCCCPGPPCEEAPFVLIVVKENPGRLKPGEFFLKNAPNYSGSIKVKL